MSNLAETSFPASAASVSPVNRFYRTVWRWHFYAGLFVLPFMLALATTGIVYLFKPQLGAVMVRHVLFVPLSAAIWVGQSAADVAGLSDCDFAFCQWAGMWWHRRPGDRLGVSEMPAVAQSWRVPLAIVSVLGVAFPLVGFSLLVVLLLDYVVISCIPPLKRTLG